jgi:hypothetical protein
VLFFGRISRRACRRLGAFDGTEDESKDDEAEESCKNLSQEGSLFGWHRKHRNRATAATTKPCIILNEFAARGAMHSKPPASEQNRTADHPILDNPSTCGVPAVDMGMRQHLRRGRLRPLRTASARVYAQTQAARKRKGKKRKQLGGTDALMSGPGKAMSEVKSQCPRQGLHMPRSHLWVPTPAQQLAQLSRKMTLFENS